MIPIDLSGKLAVVTGATGELGRVMTRTVARAGADVAVCYHRSRETAEALVAECRQMGVKAEAFQVDVTDKASIEGLRDQVKGKLGVPSIIVNNAVIQYDWTTVLEQDEADYTGQFKSCVLHNVFMAQAFVPGMIEAGWGRVIGINTECAMQYWESQSAYDSGKRGMDGVLRVLAREVGRHGITVNQVAPGWIASETRPDTGSDAEKSYTDNVPLKRRGSEQEVANAVLFLASDLSSFITGAYIPVCGGNVMPAI